MFRRCLWLARVAAIVALSATAHHQTFAGDVAREESAIEIYNFSQLVNKAERIVLAEIVERKEGRLTIGVIESLKAPAHDPKNVAPEAFKLAADRLSQEKEKPANAPGVKAAPEKTVLQLVVNSEMRLPPAGVQALFFLWLGEKPEDAPPAAYAVKHPQCIYDANVLPQVRSALMKPRSISDGRYLRDWDRRAAEKLAQRKADAELKQIPGGEPVLGIRLDCVRPRLALRGDNSFLVTSHLVNVFGKELLVYDGPSGVYGAILKPKGASAEKSLVLRLGGFEGIDPAALNVTSLLDFEAIQGDQLMSREQLFDAKQFPILATLSGVYTLKLFYSSSHDGMIKDRPKSGLESPAWTGTVVSKELEFEFKVTNKP